MTTEIKVNKFTTTYITDSGGYTVKLFADGALIKEQEFGYSVPIADGQRNTLFSAENFGVYTADFNTKYVLATPEPVPEPAPPPPPPPPPPASSTDEPKRYIPKGRYKKPKSTGGDEFVEVISRKWYKGYYIEDSRGRFYGGRTPQENGPELEVITKTPIGIPIGLVGLLTGFFIKKLTQFEKDRGVIKRNFIQNKSTNKIIETDPDTYAQAKQELQNSRFVETDWIIKGPAEDKNFNGYPFEGAASKNKKAIQALEKQMPGISTFITDYSYLVEDPTTNQKPVLSTTTEVEKDPQVKLKNDRKANFDLRK